MLTSILSVLAGLASIVGGYFALKNNPNRVRKQAEEAVKKEEEEMECKKQEMREAVYTQNDTKLNQIMGRILSPAILSIALPSVIAAGCTSAQPNTVYIPTDRKIESCTNSLGIACKAVPDAVFVEMTEGLMELKSMKTEAKVDKRLEK